MRFEYYLIQYIDDPLRNEGRNIGVMAHDGSCAYFRALGDSENPDDVDLSYFESLTEKTRQNGWVYREWLHWFDTLAKNEGIYPDRLSRVLGKLEAQGANFVARYGGVLDVDDEIIPEAMVNELFHTLVGKPVRKAQSKFTACLEQLLANTDIKTRPDYDWDVEVEFFDMSGKLSSSVRLPHILKDKPRTVFKIVRFRTNNQSFIRQVNDAIFTFQEVQKNSFADKGRCVVLTEPYPAEKSSYLDRLAAVAQIVDVTAKDAAARLLSIVNADG
ncbi:MAG: hypothetical protein AB9919_15010 [Geobacteraceae bacterium]